MYFQIKKRRNLRKYSVVFFSKHFPKKKVFGRPYMYTCMYVRYNIIITYTQEDIPTRIKTGCKYSRLWGFTSVDQDTTCKTWYCTLHYFCVFFITRQCIHYNKINGRFWRAANLNMQKRKQNRKEKKKKIKEEEDKHYNYEWINKSKKKTKKKKKIHELVGCLVVYIRLVWMKLLYCYTHP